MTMKVAIVGRPNVGKSTLFNRLAGRKIAIVDDQPGVTRDRKETTGRLGDLDMILIDTAGFEDVTDASLEARMRKQTEVAINEADVTIFLYDARAGVTPIDERFAQLLRKSGKPVVLAANKCEGKQGDEGLMEAWRLGLGDPAPISAEHGEGMADLFDALAGVQTKLEDSGQLLRLEPELEDDEPFDPDAEAPPERRQVDAAQWHSRGRACHPRTRGRHYARQRHSRLALARERDPARGYGWSAQARQSSGEARARVHDGDDALDPVC
jgi:GTP-binding protein